MYLILLLLWIILNGKFTWEIMVIGMIICAAVYAFIWKFADFSPRKEWHVFKSFLRILLYGATLVVEIVKANITVIYYIYNSKLEVEPGVVSFKKTFNEEAHNTVLANSITLTPGTITVHLEGDEYVVHCLDKDMARGIDDSVFVRQLQRMERSAKAKDE